MNICINCAFCVHDPDPRRQPGDHTLYDWRCAAVVHDKKIDPVTGNTVYASHEAGLLTTNKHPNCRDMNHDGNCSLYEAKQR